MMDEERRAENRFRVLKGGHVVLPGKYSTFDCVVRNLAGRGAKLVMPSTLGVPNQFELQLDSGDAHPCKVRWRSETELGVLFEDSPA
ncbi:PilZ domain-containing protein [Agrobacterium sp. ES01]|uniref:PilZ domain-containing protein n=1 Tax=Agrobacterium sp. ES01 TaxID=3420714 RepID=UPI003D0AE3D5